MSTHQSYSYSSSSYSSSATTDGRNNTTAYSEESYSDPRGTTTRTLHKEPGRPVVEQVNSFPAGGSQLPAGAQNTAQGRIEDVTDDDAAAADKRYAENIEDEYAKREGGA